MQPMLNIALRAARKAGDIILDAVERSSQLSVEEKGRNDYVTEIDRAVEREIVYHIHKAYPDHAFLGEEQAAHTGQANADYEWIIDPIDGTTNFIHGIPHYAISIACRHQGKLQHALIYDPVKQEEFTASKGGGAYLNHKRIRVSSRRGMDGALIGTGIPFNGFSLDNIDAYLACMKTIASQTAGIRRPGAASLDLAYVAAGRFDGFWEMNLKLWDIAAGVLLIQEAGGLVSDFKGGNTHLETGHVVCGTPKVFKGLIQATSKHLGHL